MKHYSYWIISLVALSLSGCGSDSDSNNKQEPGNNQGNNSSHSVSDRTVSGVSQKGPFSLGSTVTVHELEGDSLRQTGKTFTGEIKNNRGEFSISSVSLASQYALLKVNGFFRNEIYGKKSNAPITMSALADISERENVNVNLLTHLEIERVKQLVTDGGKSFDEAKKQARKELLGYFRFTDISGEAEDMNIFGNDDKAAALMAISIIMQGPIYDGHDPENGLEGDFIEYLAGISDDIADGTIDNQDAWKRMATWAVTADLNNIRENMNDWNETIPDFEKYVKKFWTSYYQLGACESNMATPWKLSEGTCFICRENGWGLADAVESVEYCQENGRCAQDGSLQSGIAVCDDGKFRFANPFEILVMKKGCTSYNQGESMQIPDGTAYYTCKDSTWSPDLNKNISEYIDTRDNAKYRAVKIGRQTWLGENMNYATASGSDEIEDPYCQRSDPGGDPNHDDHCAVWRTYSWDAAQTACPSGYHLPSQQEWEELNYFALLNGPAYAQYIIDSYSLVGANRDFSCDFLNCTYPDEKSFKCVRYSGYMSDCKDNSRCQITDDKGNPINEREDYELSEREGYFTDDALYCEKNNYGDYCIPKNAASSVYLKERLFDEQGHFIPQCRYDITGTTSTGDGVHFWSPEGILQILAPGEEPTYPRSDILGFTLLGIQNHWVGDNHYYFWTSTSTFSTDNLGDDCRSNKDACAVAFNFDSPVVNNRLVHHNVRCVKDN